jgi:hypothetical protein
MNRDKFIRRVLWASVLFNLGGASLFAFPSSALGQLAGMPSPGPALYGYMLALFVVLFGGSYAWLALSKNIDRPLLAFGAIGKTCAFVLVLTFWLLGEVPTRSVVAITGDLIFAGLFFWWLFGRPLERPAG